MLMTRILILSIFTLRSRVTDFQHFKGKYRFHFQGSKSPASLTLDLRGKMDLSKSAIHPSYPEENNPRFTLIFSILLSGYVLAVFHSKEKSNKPTTDSRKSRSIAYWKVKVAGW